jgi:small subunit ribosomal protein S8
MNVTDSVADMLTRMRNAILNRSKYVSIPASRLKIEITKILEKQKMIRGFRLIRDEKQGKIKVALKYTENGYPVLKGLERVSKPSKRVYKKSDDVPLVRAGLGFSLVSSSQGLLTDKEAKENKVGGEILAKFW